MKKNTIKKAKMTNWSVAYKGYASIYNFGIFIYFKTELQLKDAESAIRKIEWNIYWLN